MRGGRGVLALLCILPSLGWGAGAASVLANAESAEHHFEFREALALGRAGLAVGDADPRTTWRLHAVMARAAAAMGEQDLSAKEYAKVLELTPGYEVPEDFSPKLRAPFETARARLHQARLQLLSTSERRGAQVVTRVEVKGDTQELVEHISLTPVTPGPPGPAGPPLPLARSAQFHITWECTTPRCAHLLTALDAEGNALQLLGTPLAPLQLPVAPDSARPFYRRAWPYVIAAAAFAAVGTTFAIRTANENTQLTAMRQNPAQFRYLNALAVDALRRRDFALTLSGFALSAGAGVTAVVFW